MINGGKEMLVGRSASCPHCESIFIVTYKQLRNKQIHCGDCAKNGKLIVPNAAPTIAETITEREEDVFTALLREKSVK